ncbi:MAG: hypothetical protein HRT88_14410, partial [Lentisphaeraceae bacterium]|nr:hypothetical protein [Lentisphaeraceae bacterium]
CIANNDEVYRDDAWYYKLHCLFEWGKAERVLELVPQLEKLFAKSAYLADVYFLAGGASKKENKFEPAIE